MTEQASAEVDATTVHDWLNRGDPVTVLDVRTPAEFETAHIRDSYNVPLLLLKEHSEELSRRLDHHVVLVCDSGVRAREACRHLTGAGMDRVRILGGGVASYGAAGGDVVRGRPRWAMERQVRLTAGLLVLLGTVSSLWVPPMLLVTGGVGAGLTISALTNTCTMARVLAVLPYNRTADKATAERLLARLPTRDTA